jgi:hypothetical protein
MFLTGVLGVMRILGMGGVFEGVLLVVARIMEGFVMAFGGFGGRRDGFDRGGLGRYRGFGRGRVMGVIIMMMIVFV